MNNEAQIYLKGILAKPESELLPQEIDFLRARWSYVGKESRKRLAEVVKAREVELKQEPVEEEKTETEEETPETNTSEHPADTQETTDTDDGEDEV